MRKLFKKLQKRHGISLIEVLVALVLTGIITTAVFRLYLSQHQQYIAQDDVSNIQQNARASIDELSRHIRMAGHQLPFGLEPVEAFNSNPDTIVIRYKGTDCDTYIDHQMPNPSAELRCGTAIDCFNDGDWVYIYDPDSGYGDAFEITEVQAAAMHIQHNTMTLSRAYDSGAILFALDQVKYFIDTTDTLHPNLMVQFGGSTPQVYAENITDLQCRYRLANGTIVDEPILIEDVREVLLSVTGRSQHPDYSIDSLGYRERSYSSSVFLRNIGL